MGLPTVPGLLLSLVRWKTRGKGGLLARPGGSGHVLGVGVGAGISLLGFACRLAVPHLGLPERERESCGKSSPQTPCWTVKGACWNWGVLGCGEASCQGGGIRRSSPVSLAEVE